MKLKHTKPTKEKWEIFLYPYADFELYEDAPYNEDTRAMYRLIEPIRAWLDSHEHGLVIDRGDFGEGSENFYITIYSETDFNDLKNLCENKKTS